MRSTTTAITCSHISVQSDHTTRLHPFDVQLESGQIILIVGASGAGKTTFLHVLAGLLEPTTGEISYEGSPNYQDHRPSPDWLMHSGFVFQQPEQQLFSNTVQKELMYSLKPFRLPRHEAHERIGSTLAEVQLGPDVLDSFPFALSGGQKRRIGIASTLVTHPDWLLFDEPTAGLDAGGTHQFVQLCEKLCAEQSKSIVISTHDLDAFLPVAHRVLILADGRLVADETPESLYRDASSLITSGVGLPESIQMFATLRQLGIPCPDRPSDTSELAAAIFSWTKIPRDGTDDATADPNLLCDDSVKSVLSAPVVGTAKNAVHPEKQTNWIRLLDTRVKWISTFALSLAILLTPSWIGLSIVTVLVSCILWVSRIPARKWWVLRPLLLFALLSTLLSGLTFSTSTEAPWWHHLLFSMPQALETVKALSRIVLIVLLSVVMTEQITTVEFQSALEQCWPGQTIPKAWEAVTLGASLTLRFMPMMANEWRRFSLILSVRAKVSMQNGQVRWRDLPALLIPLLISTLQFADAYATALEARGYKQLGLQRTRPAQTPWLRRDALTTIVVFLVSFGLIWIGA